MLDAILIARSGLANASEKLDAAARTIADSAGSQAAPSRADGPITGATGVPFAEISDPAGALLDLMTAELSYKLNVQTLKTASEMIRSLYDVID